MIPTGGQSQLNVFRLTKEHRGSHIGLLPDSLHFPRATRAWATPPHNTYVSSRIRTLPSYGQGTTGEVCEAFPWLECLTSFRGRGCEPDFSFILDILTFFPSCIGAEQSRDFVLQLLLVEYTFPSKNFGEFRNGVSVKRHDLRDLPLIKSVLLLFSSKLGASQQRRDGTTVCR